MKGKIRKKRKIKKNVPAREARAGGRGGERSTSKQGRREQFNNSHTRALSGISGSQTLILKIQSTLSKLLLISRALNGLFQPNRNSRDSGSKQIHTGVYSVHNDRRHQLYLAPH